MTQFGSVRFGRRSGTLLAVLTILAVAAGAQGVVAAPPGHIDFDAADLPPATVEVDLSQAMLGNLLGIGDAALAGVVEGLAEAAGDGGEDIELAADKIGEARELVQLASQMVTEVRVRVYEDFDDADQAGEVFSKFDAQLRDGNWDTVVRARDGDESVRVSMLCDENAIRGILVVAGDHGDLVLVNIVCDVSPERVKQLTSMATKAGLENGLRPVLQAHMHQLRPHIQHAQRHED